MRTSTSRRWARVAAKVVTSAECQATSLGSALRRAVAKVKDRKKDFKLQAEKVGKAKESLAEEKLVVEKARVLGLATIAVAAISRETVRTARARAKAKPAKVSEFSRKRNIGRYCERCHA